MPCYIKCPICGFDGPHGFVQTNGGLKFYHQVPDKDYRHTCSWYQDAKGEQWFRTELELFEAVVVPRTAKTPAKLKWIEARRANLSGDEKRAKKLYAEWQQLAAEES